MKEETFLAWAINTNSDEGHGFSGRYFFGANIPKHMEGCVIALFKKRKEAKEALSILKMGYNPWSKVSVSRVKVSILELRQD